MSGNSNSMDILRQSAAMLLKSKQFYYNILTQFEVRPLVNVGTIGVAYMSGKMVMVYDPQFVSYYTPTEFQPIIEHEINHFLYDHCQDFRDTGTKDVFESEEEAKDHIRKKAMEAAEHKLRNIAMDRSINIYINDLPYIRIPRKTMLSGDKEKDEKASGEIKGIYRLAFKEDGTPDPENDIVEVSGITEESFKSLLTKSGYTGDVNKIEKFEGWKYYYELLKSCPKIQQEAEAIQTMDIHFVSGKMEGMEPGEGQSLTIKGQEGQESEGEDQPQDGKGQGEGQDSPGEGRERRELQGKDSAPNVTETPGVGPSPQQTGRMVFDAMRKSNSSKLPGHLKAMLERIATMYDSEPLPWYMLLRKLVNTSIRSVMENNVNVRNRRTTVDQILPGYITRPLLDIAVIWDVSGSCMDNETQGHFVNEVNALAKAGANITVYYTDVDVEHIQKVGTKPLKPEKYEIRGNGGTHLDNGIVRAIKDKNHIIIMLTDGYMSFTLTKSDLKGRKVITCTTGDSPPKSYGPSIEITTKTRN